MDASILEMLFKTWLMPSVLSAMMAFLLGIIWYHPKVCNGWLASRGKKAEELGKYPATFIISFPLWFLTSLFFTFMVVYIGTESPAEIFLLACLLWVAFAMPPLVMGSLYTGDPFTAVAVDASYQLAGYYTLAVTHIVLAYLDVI